jgi:thiol-disulfide isomerase/thioredoxin
MNAYVSTPNADAATGVEARRIIASPIRARAPFAPDFSFTTHENESLSNAALRGKVVLLDFWGTWCPPCRESIPVVRGLQKKYAGKGFQIVGISSDDDEDVWRTFIQAQQMSWSEYIDLSRTVQQAFKIDSFPTYILLDKDGVIRYRQSGFGELTQGELEDAINKALKRESDPKLAAAALAEQQAGPAPNASGNSSSDSSAGDSSASSSTASSHVRSPNSSPAGRSSAAMQTNSSQKSVAKAEGEPASEFGGVEGGIVSANIYKNAALGLTFQVPAGLVPASFASLHAINEGLETSSRTILLAPGSSPDGALHPVPPKYIFYASRKGEWDGRQTNMPSISISALPMRADSLEMGNFKKLAEIIANNSGMKILPGASDFTANKQHFLRADFERSIGSLRVYQSYLQTAAHSSVLVIEINAYSLDELQQVAGFLQSISIAPENP